MDGFVIMGAGIDHAVIAIVMGQILVGAAFIGLIKGKLQHLHIGEAAVLDQLANTIGQKAQILHDHRSLA